MAETVSEILFELFLSKYISGGSIYRFCDRAIFRGDYGGLLRLLNKIPSFDVRGWNSRLGGKRHGLCEQGVVRW